MVKFTKRFIFSVDEETYELLRREAEAKKMKISELLRMIVREYFIDRAMLGEKQEK